MAGGGSEGAVGGFHTTHWSVVLAAADRSTSESREALETLCRSYWYPIYAFLRRDGYAVHDAQDLTQEFLARVVERNPLAGIEPRGKFRYFLLVTLKHFVSDQRKHDRAQKRGGGHQLIPIDAEAAEQRYRFEPIDPQTPETLFERRWATTVLEQSLKRLQTSYEAQGLGGLFVTLRPCLTGASHRLTYAELGLQLGQSETAIKGAVHRLRRQFGELLRIEIAQTVSNPAEIDEEIRQLISAGMTGIEIPHNLSPPNSL